MSELTPLTGTLKASELIAKLEQGFVLERLPYWSLGSPEEDRRHSVGFYREPAYEHNGHTIQEAHYAFGFGSAFFDRKEGADMAFAEIVREPQRWNCYDRKHDDYPDQFNLNVTADNNPKK